MTEDKWFRLINDDLIDIPARVQQLKTAYWKKSALFIVLVVIGSATMGVASNSGPAAVGCFLAVTGIIGIMTLATMSHTELCLYRALKEVRQINNLTDRQ